MFYPTVLSNTSKGITTTVLTDGTMNFSGTLTDTWFNYFSLESSSNGLNEGTYTISAQGDMGNVTGISIKGWYNSANWEYFFQVNKPKTFSITGSRKFYLVGFGNSGSEIEGNIKVQIEKGDESTPIEDYIKTPQTTITIPKGSTGNRVYTAKWTAN